MASRRRSISCLVAAASVLLAVTVLLRRLNSVATAGRLQPGEVREIQRTVSHERWRRMARGIRSFGFRLVRSHLQEMILGRIISVSSENPDEARVEVREESETGRRWDYQLERQTNDWKVIGVGYRSALTKTASHSR